MRIFTEEQHEDIASETSEVIRKYEAAKQLASLGLHIFPARPFDGAAFDKAQQEYIEEQAAAKAEGRRATLDQKHFKQYGGKAGAFRDQYNRATCVMAQVEKWWDPVKGQYRGNNICLMTGEKSGVVVIDLDVKPEEGVDGFEWWNSLTAEHGDVDTFRVRSGGQSSGGMHIYFKWREGVKRKDGFAKGVDIRSDDSHVVGPFSQCQGVYDPITFDEVAEMPDWLYSVLTRKAEPKTRTRQTRTHLPGMEEEAAPAEFATTPLDQIEEMLEYIDVVEHDEWWQNICNAIKSEHNTEEGYAVLDAWSAGNVERYTESDNRDYWNRRAGAKEDGVSINTLYRYAEECGWINPRRTGEDVDIITAVRMMNRSFAIIDPDQCVLEMKRKGKALDRSKLPPCWIPSMTLYKTRAVLVPGAKETHSYGKVAEVMSAQIRMMTARYQVPTETPTGKPGKPRSLYDVWLGSPARQSYASAGFYINDRNCPPGVLNLFPGFKVQPVEGHPTAFMRHVLEILCNGDEERARWVINRLAYVVQYGDQIMSTALAVTGDQGSGKTIVADYMGRVLGELNYKYLHDSNGLDSRFSEELVGKFVVCADEAIFAGDPKLRNKMKSLIGANILRDEGKGKAAKEAQNVMFLMIFSNEDEPVSVERGDRRFTIMKTNNKYSKLNREQSKEVDKEARGYFKTLVKEMKGDGPAKLLHMLLNWEVDFELARTALETQEKQIMAEKRVLKCDSVTAYLFHLYITGFEVEDPDDHNSIGEGWGGRSQMGPFYEAYRDWTNGQRHRNGEWKIESVQEVRKRLFEDFMCNFVKPRNKSMVCWPSMDQMRECLRKIIPEAIEELGEYDASQETEF